MVKLSKKEALNYIKSGINSYNNYLDLAKKRLLEFEKLNPNIMDCNYHRLKGTYEKYKLLIYEFEAIRKEISS